MTQLSPAAQAVLDAVREICPAPADEIAAAALRAVTDQVVPPPRLPYDSCCDVHAAAIRAEILAIAAELEGSIEPTFTPEEIEMIQAPWSYLQSQQKLEGGR